jgi:hypothetical protein
MDYPAPRVGLVDGQPDLSDAYGAGLGRWDRFAIDWLYGTDSEAEAQRKLQAGLAEGLRYTGDNDARPIGSAQPWGSLWDDDSDPAAELTRMMEVRRAALQRFGVGALQAGEPVANLRRKFVPVWLLHRYQVEAAAKIVGGVDFTYSVRGDGQETSTIVSPEVQRRALEALMATLSARELEVPEPLLPLLSSGWSGNSDRQFDIEIFRTAGGPVFDPMAATDAAAAHTLNTLLAPERLNRLAEQGRVVNGGLSANEVIDRLVATAFPRDPGANGDAAVQRRIATTTALALARVQRDPALSSTLSLALDERLQRLAVQLAKARGDDAHQDWSRGLARLLRDREALDKALAEPNRAPKIPPGMPIGGADGDWLGD